ncbi:uncharacterized protein LOC130673816 [Microplitis mediator]|uniref:uncharacterized protein LOC130673816 n=1 Tax=Microplitis mediator TaxID=375433 RepID=UPI002556C23D|nr:uncharacterized protein LOC130673816 [Microplitis mediator]
MAIKYKVVNVDIQTSISLLQKFIKKLTEDVGHYRNSVDVFYKNYLSTLIGDNEDTKYLRPYSEFNKVDSMYKKFKRFLNDFLTTIMKDYADALEISSNIRLLKNEFDNIVKEYSHLYKNSPKNGIEVNKEFSSMENLKQLHYAVTKLDKIKRSYNERVIAYNEYILQFYGIERNFENRILTFITRSNKTHSLNLDCYTEYFTNLLKNDSIGSKKREILKGYLKNLTLEMEGFSKSSLRGVKKINIIDFGRTDFGENSNNDQTKSAKQNLFSVPTDISRTEKPRSSGTSVKMPQIKASSPQPISSAIPMDIPQTGTHPEVIFRAPLNRISGASFPQTNSPSPQPNSSAIPEDVPQTGTRPKVIFRAPLTRSSGASFPQTNSPSPQPNSSAIPKDIPQTGTHPEVIFRAPLNRISGASFPQTNSPSPQPNSSAIPKDIPQTGTHPEVIFRAPLNRISGASFPQTKSPSPQPNSSAIPKDIPQTGTHPEVIFRAPLNRISGASFPQTKSPSPQPNSSAIPKDIPQTGLSLKPMFGSRFKRSSELSDEFSKTKSEDCPLKRDPMLPLEQCCLIPNANEDPIYKKDNYLFDISNTCGFDSITQILLASITDDFCYASKMNTSSSDVIKFIFKLLTADNRKAAKLRNDYLAVKFMETNEFISNNYRHHLNFYRTLTPIWNVYFNSLPSGYYYYECHSIRQPKSSLAIVYEDIREVGRVGNRRKIDMSIQDKVNELLAEPERFKCPECDRYVSSFELNDQVFIDITLMAKSDVKLYSDLELFPISLTLLGRNFRLAGVIERVPGHFIANVRRIDGSWEVHNDLKNEIFKLNNFKKAICPEAAIYIKE